MSIKLSAPEPILQPNKIKDRRSPIKERTVTARSDKSWRVYLVNDFCDILSSGIGFHDDTFSLLRVFRHVVGDR